ncbi:ABC transporter substrate-binding protein [Shumkonia mesophila]|uniref:ABC transporter substrate-binding protein n=1 Tax=Shumkonia mesophila TaxID=2838854 RepID=UPI002934D46D|nr:sugar ABC transporter substrate-binding protein [Shumkonia mesophila]
MFGFSKHEHLFGMAAASLLALAATTAHAQSGKITLTFANWASAEGATRPGIEKVIADFEAANPNVKINSEAISFSEIARQLVLRVRSGNPPDVAQVAGNDTILVATTGGVEPLDAYVGTEFKSTLKPDALNGLTVDGKLIALPWNQAPAGLWYNKTILKQAGLDPDNPPATIDALMAAMAAIKKSHPDVIPLGVDTTNRAFSMSSNWPWMRTFGAKPIGADATGATSKEMKAYLSWMREIAQKGYIDPGRKIGEFRPLIAQGKVAFLWDQVLVQGVIQSTNKMSDADFYKTYGVTVMPAGPSGKPASFEGGHQLVMFANSKNKDAAWAFMKYLATSPEAIRNYTVSYNASLPPLANVTDAPLRAQLDTPIFNAYRDKIIPTLTPQPYGAKFAAAATAVMAGVQEAVTGTKPIDDIAQSIQEQLDRR